MSMLDRICELEAKLRASRVSFSSSKVQVGAYVPIDEILERMKYNKYMGTIQP